MQVGDQVVTVPLRGRLFEQRESLKSPLAVGDRVSLDVTGQAIEARLARRSQLARAAAGEGDREQVLAANVDQVLVVTTARQPEFRPSLVDHVLAGAERQHLTALVVINKLDLVTAAELEPLCALYRGLGYTVLPTCSLTGAGVPELRTQLCDRISVVCGQSGVGKSSLLNAVEPGLRLKTGAVGHKSQEGRHTTTHASLLPVPGGGHVVDTPGVRNFGLFELTAPELPWLFRDIAAVGRECTFGDCLHRSETDCAVRAALGSRIAPSRYQSYLELLEEIASRRRQAERRPERRGRPAPPSWEDEEEQ